MAYLITNDLRKSIQSENLSQVIGGNTDILDAAILTAIEEARSYLVQKYDVDKEFSDTIKWAQGNTYYAGDRVYLDADAYVDASTYNVGALVVHSGYVYRCNTNGTTGAWNASKWDLLGKQYSIFNAKYPHPVFDYNALYAVGDQVFWKNKNYTCKVQTRPLSQEQYLQYREIQNTPYLNPAPDDVNNGLAYWGSGSSYSISNVLITDTSKWQNTDNRSQQLLTYVVDIALYHVHARIAPRNIPDLRVKRYDDAKDWLKMAAKGEITAAIPVLKPLQGLRVRYGGNVKNVNSY